MWRPQIARFIQEFRSPLRAKTAGRTAQRWGTRRLHLEPLEDRTVPTLSAALVTDINMAGANSNPTALAVVDDTLFFAATTVESGTELWKTDGTAAGTML